MFSVHKSKLYKIKNSVDCLRMTLAGYTIIAQTLKIQMKIEIHFILLLYYDVNVISISLIIIHVILLVCYMNTMKTCNAVWITQLFYNYTLKNSPQQPFRIINKSIYHAFHLYMIHSNCSLCSTKCVDIIFIEPSKCSVQGRYLKYPNRWLNI